MATPAKQFLSLASDERRRVHFTLCEQALGTWREYAATQNRIAYVDTVVGLRHEVDLALPEDAFRAARNGRDSKRVKERYAEPIVAMRDDDLEFPEHIEFAYYSIYNLFHKYALGDDVDDWLIVNQAISSEVDQTKWLPMLSGAMDKSV